MTQMMNGSLRCALLGWLGWLGYPIQVLDRTYLFPMAFSIVLFFSNEIAMDCMGSKKGWQDLSSTLVTFYSHVK
jgi:hypothetical protein